MEGRRTVVATAQPGGVVAALALVLVALCLRGPIAAVGPVLAGLRADLGLSATPAAALTSLPLLCFGILAPVAPVLAARYGLHRAVLLGVGALGLGLALRAAGVPGLFLGTLLVGGGIAICNVLLPAVAKADFGRRWATVTGLTTAGMAVGASAGAGLAQPLADLSDSAQRGLVWWVAPVLLALLVFTPLARRQELPVTERRMPLLPMLRDRTAVAVTLFFGLQSLAFYTMLAWLPSVLHDDAGQSAHRSGVLLAAATLLGVPASIVVPKLASRTPSQGPWVLGVGGLLVAALGGLLLAPAAAPVLWTVLYGLAVGASFPLAMTLVLLRTRDAGHTARLSATAQCVGYLLAATGPLAVGLLHDAASSWQPCLVLLLALALAQTGTGLAAARHRTVAVD